VFADYELASHAAAGAGHVIGRPDVLGFTLGGLSKSAGLPQMKLAWIALSGPEDRVRDARGGLELIADTYLSVSTPVQVAAAALLRDGASVRAQIQRRLRENLATLEAQAAAAPACRLLRADGGWYTVLQVPSLMSEDELVLSILDDADVLVHPGYFFDFPSESFLIVSLLPPVRDFTEATARILTRFAGVETA
jgi:aspartate/methionine/tyrosine aminotransferase